jgi:D-3-phosphoglycerate dehydrogenase
VDKERILIADSLEPQGWELLREAGFEVDQLAAEERPRLAERIGDYVAVIVRSATRLDRELLQAAARLRVVGRAGIGVDNIDVPAATERGVLVVNAPTANLVSATEHTFALLLAVARRVTAADAALKESRWDRKSYVGQELYGKTLGIVGFGQIGQRVAQRAKAFEMEVVAHDPFLNSEVARRLDVEAVELETLLRRADVVTFHTPLTDQTRGMLGREQIALLKREALVVNCGRGGVIDEEALLEALDAGTIAGAGLDVYAREPLVDFRLASHPRVVATPHIGAQTREAQERVATEIARMVVAALAGSLAVTAVNLPFRPAGTRGEPYVALGELLGRFASSVSGEAMSRLRVDLWGIEELLRAPVTVAALKGALTPFLGEAVNYVNAERLAGDRNIEVVRSTHSTSAHPHLIGVAVEGPDGETEVAGMLYGEEPRVVQFAGFHLEFRPEGLLLVLRNRDVPGVVGRLGTLLGEAGINIADIHLARREGGEDALAVLRLDQEPPAACLEELRALPEVRGAQVVDLRG